MESAASPLRRLLRYAVGYRRRIILASLYSVLNKIFDILPPLLIGLGVDTVVERENSFISRFGPDDIMGQLSIRAGW